MAQQIKKEETRIKVKVTRPFYYEDKLKARKNGEILMMRKIDYLQWRAAGKVERIEDEPEPEAAADPKKPTTKKDGGK